MTNLIIFAATYAGIALGAIPGLALDRTGIALLGAIAMVVTASLTPAQALSAIDFPTILLLYGLMIVSAQFRIGGFYSYLAEKIISVLETPRKFLALLMASSAILSSVLTNDIVCLAFTPVITIALLKKRINPVPFLIGLAISANIGSALTIIGNPQNMLIGQSGKLDFAHFTLWCLPPVIIGILLSYFIIIYIYRDKLESAFVLPSNANFNSREHTRPFNRHQSIKGFVILIAVIVLFFSQIPREITVITAAALLMISRTMKTIELLELVDWHLITLFCGLFIVIEGICVTGIPAEFVDYLASAGFNLHNGNILTAVSLALSNIVSNVPAVMLIVPHLDKANPQEWYILALSSTFAGNLFTIGSIANLITFEIAGSFGVKISFREHAKTGIPVTLTTIIVLLLWITVIR